MPVADTYFSSALFIAAALALIVISVLYRFGRKPSLCSLGSVWMLITFSLVANVVAPIGTIMAERLLYLPSLGFCL